MELSAGVCLGPYEILAAAGFGGMGEVYRARDTRLDRTVALKILPPDLAGQPDRRARFEREAKALAALNHPNIVTIYSIERAAEREFLTMELVAGKTLAQMIPAAGMTLSALLTVATALCNALAAAHKQGVIHRDLKPANVMVSDEGVVKLLDFGLARLENSTVDAAPDGTTELHTREGQLLGTCEYMSPEQVEGRRVDHRSDLFSLGTILFEMATGRRPFQGSTRTDVLIAILRGHPPGICALNPAMPSELDRLVARCLTTDPAGRIQTASDVHGELTAIKAATGRAAAAAQAASATAERRVAVLPFANMSADPDQEYFCDGMAEEIINALSHVEGLEVAARTSAFAFKGQHRDIREIGRLLDVGAALEGSVRRAGNRLRITAQLIRVADGMHLWSERFDREFDDVFAIQDEISLAIVDRLKVRLLGGEEARLVKRHTVDPDAHDLYLRGRYFFNRRIEGDMVKAMSLYRQAAAKDPQFALPHVGLADALAVMATWAMRRPGEVCPQAKAEAERALAIDPDLGEAHMCLGCIGTIYDWDWPSAERRFRHGLALNPRYAFGRHWYAVLLCILGRFGEAVEQCAQYLQLEPLSPTVNTHAGMILLAAGRTGEGIDQLHKAVELDPALPLPHYWLCHAYSSVGRIREAADAVDRAARMFPGSGGPMAALRATTCALQGKTEEARQLLADLEERAKHEFVGGVSVAFACAAVGEVDKACEWLDRAYLDRDPQLPMIAVVPNPHLRTILPDPRVQAIIRKLGLSASHIALSR